MLVLSIYWIDPTSDTMLGGTDDSNNIESSMNTDFIPELDHEDFVLQQQHDLGSPDVVSLSEGLSTSDGPTLSLTVSIALRYNNMPRQN